MKRAIAATLLIDVAAPVAAFFLLVRLGIAPVWALATSAGVSVVLLGIQWLRTREVSTLGGLVLVRFALGWIVALLTGDARFVLLKDYLVTLVIAVGALGTLRLERPFIARIRRELSGDRARFDVEWATNPPFRAVHRQLTRWWVAGLIGEVVVAVVLIYSTPLPVAVIATNVLTPTVLLTLIALTQHRASRTMLEREPRCPGGTGPARAPPATATSSRTDESDRPRASETHERSQAGEPGSAGATPRKELDMTDSPATTSEPVDPEREAALDSLERLVGRWDVSGPGLRGRVEFRWLNPRAQLLGPAGRPRPGRRRCARGGVHRLRPSDPASPLALLR